jgi:carbonic anhydrase
LTSPPPPERRDPQVILQLEDGYRRFRDGRFAEYRALFEVLAHQGQHPKVMLVACCDARVDPALLTSTHPGELFIVRNVANLIPPYEPDSRHHGTSAALEFAVRSLDVSHIIILGHALCGGVRALHEHHTKGIVSGAFLPNWLDIAQPACEALDAAGQDGDTREGARELERQVVRVGLANLRSFPFVAEAEAAGRLSLHGGYVDIEAARLYVLDQPSDRFREL